MGTKLEAMVLRKGEEHICAGCHGVLEHEPSQ